MKAVLISIQPYWVFLIIAKAMGWNIKKEKTVEVRKNYPKAEAWDKTAKIYCSKDKKSFDRIPKEYQPLMKPLLGKVIGEFVCDKIDRIAHCGTCNNDIRLRIVDEKICYKELDYAYLDNCKLSYTDIDRYSNGCDVYGWHISDLVIYDEPKLLHHFFKPCDGCDKIGTKRCTEELTDCRAKVITRPPQSWCYVESEVQKDEYL